MKKSEQISQLSAYVTELEIKIDGLNEKLDLQEEKIKVKDNIIFNMTTELDRAKKMIAAQENAIRQYSAEHRLRHQAYNL
jgi:uncharacterized coiled-coil protein SlyX